jgi:hypothetical protein
MVAAAGLSRTTYRTGFDVSLPTYSVLQAKVVVDRSTLTSKRRKWLLASPQVHVEPAQRRILSGLYADHRKEMVLFESCSKDGDDKICKVDGHRDNEVTTGQLFYSSNLML